VKRCPALVAALLLVSGCGASSGAVAWKAHIIDNSSEGADGVKVFDANNDGLPDLVAAWETGNAVRIYLNPGRAGVGHPWPRVEVGSVKGPEDALLVDLDRDGVADVVSATEGTDVPGGDGVFIHWAPPSPKQFMDPTAWTSVKLPVSAGENWIQAAAFQVDDENGPDIVAGTHTGTAKVVALLAPANARDVDSWTAVDLHRGGKKVMSLIPHDFDGDGDLDVLVSGSELGWLENPGCPRNALGTWPLHTIGRLKDGSAFAAIADLDADGFTDVVVPIDEHLVWFRGADVQGRDWHPLSIDLPGTFGTAKAVSAADIDSDGQCDLVLSRTWNRPGMFLAAIMGRDRTGIVWISSASRPTAPWRVHAISGVQGIKFDLVPVCDIDGDGDLDVATTEEKVDSGRGLGVIWYENPGP